MPPSANRRDLPVTAAADIQPHVLVVDDDPAVCHVTGQMLEMHGYQVLYAENGEKALSLFDQYDDQVSILVADVVMPKMSGIEATRKIMKSSPSARIIMVSAMGQESLVMEAIEAGASDFIVKPFKAEDVLSVVRKVLGDGWTAVTRDRSLSAQFEHSIGVTETGCEIFTLSPKGLDKPPFVS